ncbi:MAG: matrixin family metalloprotease [Candidatus Woesearchaeota archaeon]
MKKLLTLLVILLLVSVAYAKPDKGPLTKLTFVHYKAKPNMCGDGTCQGFESPQSCPVDCGGEPDPEPTPDPCYTFLAEGMRWKQPVYYVINPTNSGLATAFVKTAISDAAAAWDSHIPVDMFLSYSLDSTANWDSKYRDGNNELVFGNYKKRGVIAVTNIWGYFSGPVETREIVEFDILFDTDFTWGDAKVNSNIMDLQNIATHEFGHGLGLGDLYSSDCTAETMYGYSTEGDTAKRDLNAGDIEGIQKLYS